MSQLYSSPELPSSPIEQSGWQFEASTVTVDELIALCNFSETEAEPTPRTIIDSHADIVTGESVKRLTKYAHRNNKSEAVESHVAHMTAQTKIRSAGEVVQLTLASRDENDRPSARYKGAVEQSFGLLLNEVHNTMKAPDTDWPSTLTPLIETLNAVSERSIKNNNLQLAQAVIGYSDALGIKAQLTEETNDLYSEEQREALMHHVFAQSLSLYIVAASGDSSREVIHSKAEETASLLSEYDSLAGNPRIAALKSKVLFYISRCYALTGGDKEADYYTAKSTEVFETDNSVKGWVPNTVILALGKVSEKVLDHTLPAASVASVESRLDREQRLRDSLF